jgi:hypothetical protein
MDAAESLTTNTSTNWSSFWIDLSCGPQFHDSIHHLTKFLDRVAASSKAFANSIRPPARNIDFTRRRAHRPQMKWGSIYAIRKITEDVGHLLVMEEWTTGIVRQGRSVVSHVEVEHQPHHKREPQDEVDVLFA